MRLTGSKNEVDAKLGCKKICRLIQRIGFPDAKFSNYKIESLVGSADCRFPIRLESMAMEHIRGTSYEPELFPGLVYRMEDPKVSILIFVSGKVVITGGEIAADSKPGLRQGLPNSLAVPSVIIKLIAQFWKLFVQFWDFNVQKI